MLFVVIIISLICLYFFFSTSDSAKAEEINRLASLQAKSIIDQKEAELQGKFKKTEYDLINKYNNKIAQKLNEMESFKHNIEIQYKKESLDSIEAHKKEINTYYNNLIADHMNQYNDAKLRLEDEKKVLEKEYQSKIAQLDQDRIDFINALYKSKNEADNLQVQARQKISESESAIFQARTKYAEYVKLITEQKLKKIELDKKEEDLYSNIDDFNMAKAALESKVSDLPILIDYIASIHSARTELQAYKLANKKSPAIKSAEQVRELNKKFKELYTEKKTIEYKLMYYLYCVPWLEELDDEPLDTSSKNTVFNKNYENNNDEAGYWLTPEEYSSLTDTEKYQRALERYCSRNKSNAEIGRDFERYIGYLYETDGYDVQYKGIIDGFEDRGRDLVCKKNGETLVVQCKYWSKKKTIHEKHINQLFGTTVKLYFEENPDATIYDYANAITFGTIKPIFITLTTLSDVAKSFAHSLGVQVIERTEIPSYPMIKCNINTNTEERIYHLPFDQQYDKIKIDKPGEFYAMTVKEAEEKGFRRAKRWLGK